MYPSSLGSRMTLNRIEKLNLIIGDGRSKPAPTVPVRSLSIQVPLPTGKIPLALLRISGQAFFGIFALEAELLQLAFDG